ncbi:unnamed protein product [Cylicocyclus nassatus]|uniref:Uncharacterized protein n=1 Tax=Cylicocyclus nassatus TaxID=53992 RepID=A0AA36GZV6_CYLNA|nr:unnamed protein product [Cylicocyclus nassatus]
MWHAIPNIVNICSYGVWSNRMYTFEGDGQETMFMESFPEHPVQHCNILFVTDNDDLTIPTDIRYEYNNCSVYVSSDKLPNTFSNSLSIVTYPYRIKPGEPLREDLFADIPLNKSRDVSLITLLSFFVRRYRMTSMVINTKDAHKLVPMFFSDGSMEESRLITCQLNIAYPKPTTYEEKQDFRTAWERLVGDRYYLVRQASRTKDTLNLFLVNIVNPICWQLYVALDLPTTETF